MPTVRRILTRAMRAAGVLGIGQTASAEDMTDAFDSANAMLAQWSARRWLVFRLKDVWCMSLGPTQTYYLVGLGGDLDTQRPNRIEAAYLRMNPPPGGTRHEFELDDPNSITDYPGAVLGPVFGGTAAIDYPLVMLPSMEDYSQIGLKGLSQMPDYAFYESDFPMGKLYVWPLPNTNYEIHIIVREQLRAFVNLSDDMNLPPEYADAIHYCMADRIIDDWQLPPRSGITAKAVGALDTIRAANAQVPLMQMPAFLRSRLPSGGTVAAAWGTSQLGSLAPGVPGGGPDTGMQLFVIGETPVSGGVFGP